MVTVLNFGMTQTIRELGLYSSNDKELYENIFADIFSDLCDEKSFDVKESFRKVYNTIPAILLRYSEDFGGIGCRLPVLARLVLTQCLVKNFLIEYGVMK